MLGGGGHGALFMGVDSFINQREIAAGVRWGGGCGGMAVDVFVTVSRGDCLWKVSAASVELSLQPSSKQRAIQFLSVSLSTHAEDTRGPPPPPRNVQVFHGGVVFLCVQQVWYHSRRVFG